MADSPNNIEKSYNKYIFKYVCIQSCGNRSLLKYLISCLRLKPITHDPRISLAFRRPMLLAP